MRKFSDAVKKRAIVIYYLFIHLIEHKRSFVDCVDRSFHFPPRHMKIYFLVMFFHSLRRLVLRDISQSNMLVKIDSDVSNDP